MEPLPVTAGLRRPGAASWPLLTASPLPSAGRPGRRRCQCACCHHLRDIRQAPHWLPNIPVAWWPFQIHMDQSPSRTGQTPPDANPRRCKLPTDASSRLASSLGLGG